MIVRRVYQKGNLLLECEKEFVDLTKTPDVDETDVWNCTFRMSGHRMNVKIDFDNMIDLFKNIARSPRGKCKASKEVIDQALELSNQGMYAQDIAKELGLAPRTVYGMLKYMLKENEK
jgi:hypothetical protein